MKKVLVLLVFVSIFLNVYSQSYNLPNIEEIQELQVLEKCEWVQIDGEFLSAISEYESVVKSFFKFSTTASVSQDIKFVFAKQQAFTVVLYEHKDGKIHEIKRETYNARRIELNLDKTEYDVNSEYIVCEVLVKDCAINLDYRVCITNGINLSENNFKSGLNVISDAFDATALVESLFVIEGEIVYNVELIGNPNSTGYFYGASEEIGFGDGIVLSTGEASDCVGPNSSGSVSSTLGADGDLDLNEIVGEVTNDASVIQFNFVPQSDNIYFEFVFASDEYPEFAPPNNSTFNDVFAFLISGGPEMYDNENIALIPETSTPISINNLNVETNSEYYIDNENGSIDFEFDGYTVVILATASVTPGEEYFIKFGIADVGDSSYDSAIFLKKRSFGTTVTVNGSVFIDENSDGIFNESEVAASNIIIQAQPGDYYTNTDQDGNYSLPLSSGDYEISSVVPDYWNVIWPEDNNYSISIGSDNSNYNNIDFALSSDIDCPILTVDIATDILRPCFNSDLIISYSNVGTTSATEIVISLELDEEINIVSASVPYIDDGNNVYLFEISSLGLYSNEIINVSVETTCDMTLVGQTSCVKAEIHAENECTFINPGDPEFPDDGEYTNEEWDRSSVSVEGFCQDNLNAVFTITNTGDSGEGDMDGPSEYRIYFNDTLSIVSSFQILGGESIEVSQETFGYTLRLEADQRPGHPGNSHPNAVVENCGEGIVDGLGYLNDFPLDDNDQNVDEYCSEITTLYESNSTIVFPLGLTSNHYIGDNTELNYLINFQNTGTDTVFTVVIRDELSQYLDLETFKQGVSSYPCTYEIIANRTILWTFRNINLPPNSKNEQLSKGYLSFTISPDYSLPLEYGTLISNNAEIYFDFNLPEITDEVEITYWNIRDIAASKNKINNNYDSFSVYPNPTKSELNFSFTDENLAFPITIKLYDLCGILVFEKSHITNIEEKIIIRNNFSGMYLYEISNSEEILKLGKVVFE